MPTTALIRLLAAGLTVVSLLVSGAQAADDLQVIEVRQGDTLLELCRRYLEAPANCRQVAKLNRLRNPDLIRPGQELAVPAHLAKSAPVAGVVSFLKGDVLQQAPGQGERRPLLVNAALQQGTRIFTGKESSVEVAYEDGSSFYLRPESSLSLVRSRKLFDSRIVREFFLHTGEIINRIQRATGQEQRYNIQTPSAVAGTRGTVFKVAVDPAETTRSGVLQGQIGVSAMKQTVTVDEGEGTVARKGSPPQPPRRLLPAPVAEQLQKSYRSDPFQIRFAGVEKAAALRVMLTRDAAMKDVVREALLKPGDPFQVAGLADGHYWLQALSVDEVGLEGAFSPPVPLEVRVNPLPPNVQEPGNGSQSSDKELSFRWLKVADAAGYRLQVARDQDFADTLVDLKHDEVSAVARGLAPGSYFFRLSSLAADGYQGEWSNTLGFSIIPPPPPPPPAAPDLEQPASGEKQMRVRVRETVPGLTYHFQVAREPQFSAPLLDQPGSGPEVVFPRPKEPGIYYVRSRCADAAGNYGAFSPPQSFEIKRGFPFGWVGAGLGAVGAALLIML